LKEKPKMLCLETSPYFRDLDWEKLKAFYYVAKVGNISHAAPFLNLNQSSFSRSITGLEKHLGYPLFVRKRHGVTLTRKGEELLQIAEDIFLKVKKFTSRTYAPASLGKKRKIRIAATQALATYLINDHILAYHEKHSDLIFEVIGIDYVVDIILNDVDISICPQELKIPQADWVSVKFIQEPFILLEKKLYASPRYIEKYGKPKTIKDLQNHHFIAPSIPEAYSFDDAGWVLGLGVDKQDHNQNERRDPIFLSNSLECLIEAAQQGKGIFIAYDKMTALKKADLVNILPDFVLKQRQEYFMYPEYRKDDPDIIHIKEYLKNKVHGT
jgi:DNA-binding transcriptional LysR family regulator